MAASPLFTWRRLLSGRKVGPNFIVDAAVPLGDPCFLEVAAAASMESRLILGGSSRNLFFRSKWAADLERLPQSQHVGRDQQSRLVGDKTERRAESAESRAASSGFSWTLTGAGRWWRLYLFYSTIGIRQVTTGLQEGLPTQRMRIYSWNQSKARFGQVGASV